MPAKPWDIVRAEFLTSAVRRKGYPQPPRPQIAFAGRSNVGKSSLLNCLVRRRNLARTSASPGHTQQINFFLVNDRWHYVDLPGYGYAKAPQREQEKWRRMIEEYLVDNPDLRVLVALFDARRKPSELDDQLVEFAVHHDIDVLPVLTKCDKLKKNELARARRALAEHYGLPPDDPHVPVITSAQKGGGREDLLRILHEALGDEAEAQP